jgi:hypothetical protein
MKLQRVAVWAGVTVAGAVLAWYVSRWLDKRAEGCDCGR